MKQRCSDRNYHGYANYGGRGIWVCLEWILDFSAFLRDMGEQPPGMQIDRINNDSGYFKENCRWVTPKQNANNRGNNRLMTFNGVTQSVSQWATERGCSPYTLFTRILKGWSDERVLTQPIKKQNA